jgi:GntR family transcriptional regulator, transcriptional repressor for pyruvate dehydrogenase complex
MMGACDNLSLTEQTVASLKEMIISCGARPGDRFANEAALEKQLGVSRVVIREAVSRLRALGILESRQRVGLIVGKPDPFGLLGQTLLRHTLDSADLAALAELRFLLEVGAVPLAVQRATAAQVDRLVELADEMAASQAGLPDSRPVDDIELDFHRIIFEATQNPILVRMVDVLATFFFRSATEVDGYDAAKTADRSVWEHQMLAQAFRQRNVDYARVILSTHLADLLVHQETKLKST